MSSCLCTLSGSCLGKAQLRRSQYRNRLQKPYVGQCHNRCFRVRKIFFFITNDKAEPQSLQPDLSFPALSAPSLMCAPVWGRCSSHEAWDPGTSTPARCRVWLSIRQENGAKAPIKITLLCASLSRCLPCVPGDASCIMLLVLAPASLALPASHMRCSDSQGAPWLAAPPAPQKPPPHPWIPTF